jgi:hypothetical protein
MKLILVILFILSLSVSVLAVPNSQQLGPYSVSFDINANYEIQSLPPIETETAKAYQIRLFVDNFTFATISITEFADPTDSTLNVQKNLMSMSMIVEGLNVTNVEEMTIDDKEGFLVTSMPFETQIGAPSVVYRAMYWLDSQDCECGPVSVGKTSITITSTFPQDVTKSLLNSLQVVMGQPASTSFQSASMKPDTSQSETNKDVF